MGEIIEKDMKKDKTIPPYMDYEIKQEMPICWVQENENEYKIIIAEDFELKENNGKWFAVRKKPQYPKTYEECCKIGGVESISLDKLRTLRQLIYCRNIYWMIAGAQMGLRSDWKPDWRDFSTQKYSISVDRGEIITSQRVTGSRVLVFPTEEMRDAFLENFKDLIEECKELL